MNGRILIVHTAVVMRMLVKNGLAAGGYEVVGEAVNGTQALETYRAVRPDAVTMDMVLPDMDGLDTIKAIIAEFPQAAIVICTSMSEPALLAEAIRAGARSFITKPFPPLKLAKTIAALLA